MSTKWLEAKVLDNRHWTETLFSLLVEGPGLQFEAGQFVRIALDIDGERIARPFSFVNPPADPVHEFYGIVVPEGPLSPRLARSEEHTSELQSQSNLVCRLLLEKKKDCSDSDEVIY